MTLEISGRFVFEASIEYFHVCNRKTTTLIEKTKNIKKSINKEKN